MTRELDPRLLRHFVAVAEELHFSRAAERLFVAQQTLSRDVRKLEERAGTPLLDRTSRRVHNLRGQYSQPSRRAAKARAPSAHVRSRSEPAGKRPSISMMTTPCANENSACARYGSPVAR